MATNKAMTTEDWVRLAASDDLARPVLCAVHVRDDGRAEASDCYRVHLAAEVGCLAPGLWDCKTGQHVDGKFPDIDKVTPRDAVTHEIADVPELVAICKASIAYQRARRDVLPTITFAAADGYIALNAQYVLDVLAGAVYGHGLYREVKLSATAAKFPVRFDIAGFGTAVVMTIREGGRSIEAGAKRSDRFDVSETMKALEQSAAA